MVMAGLLVAQLPEGSGGLSSFYIDLHMTALLCFLSFLFANSHPRIFSH